MRILFPIIAATVSLPLFAQSDQNLDAWQRLSCHTSTTQLQAMRTIIAIEWPSGADNPTLIVGRDYSETPKEIREVVPLRVNCVLAGGLEKGCVDFDIRSTTGALIDRWRSCRLM